MHFLYWKKEKSRAKKWLSIKAFLHDKDNFIKSVRELGTEDIVPLFGLLTSCLSLWSRPRWFLLGEKNISLENKVEISVEKRGISFAREMDFFCSKLCALLSSLLLCASVNITASLRFLQTFHLKLFSSKEKFFSREKLFSNEKFFVFSWYWKNYLAVAAAAFLSCLTACRRISPESGREEKLGKMKNNSSGI